MGVEVITKSAGDKKTYPKVGDTLTMHYRGTFTGTDKEFDSSYSRNKPFQFVIGIKQVIRGWDEGVIKMSLGETAVLKITSDFAYGEDGAGDAVPPNSDLTFEVKLLAINNQKASGGCYIC